MGLEERCRKHREMGVSALEKIKTVGPLEIDSIINEVVDVSHRLRAEDYEDAVGRLLELAAKSLKRQSEDRGSYPHEELTRLNLLYRIKNIDYGDSFGSSLRELGLHAGVVRIYDKAMRLKNLVGKESTEVKDESFQDTLADLTNYCIMTVIEIRNQTGY